MSMSEAATTPTAKFAAQKNGRSEERPSSGRKRPGRAAASQSRIAIPRCSNMPERNPVRKRQGMISPDKTPHKDWEKR
jgi:hypothetical protein